MEVRKVVTPTVEAPNLVLISGSMYSGKSKKLIEIIDSYVENKKEVLIFKPKLDKRDLGVVKSRDYDRTYDAYLIGDGIVPTFKKGYLDTVDVIVVDEAQFLDKRAFRYVLGLVNGYGLPVIFAGLDKDFKGEDFTPMTWIKDLNPHEIQLKAKCFCCGRHTANQSRRIVNNEVTLHGEQILCGDTESYIAVCPKCDKQILEGRGL